MKLHARSESSDEADRKDHGGDDPSPAAFDFGHLEFAAGDARAMEARPLHTPLRLITLDQIPDALRIGFAMAVAGDWIGAAGGFDPNLRPEHSSRDMHRGHFRHGNGLVVAAKPSRLYAA